MLAPHFDQVKCVSSECARGMRDGNNRGGFRTVGSFSATHPLSVSHAPQSPARGTGLMWSSDPADEGSMGACAPNES